MWDFGVLKLVGNIENLDWPHFIGRKGLFLDVTTLAYPTLAHIVDELKRPEPEDNLESPGDSSHPTSCCTHSGLAIAVS